MGSVRVYFATNRNELPDNKKLVFGPRFNPDGVAALRFGYADFPDGVETLQGGEVHVYPDVKGETDVAKTGGGQFMNDLRNEMLDGRDTLVFVHGFNVTFNGAIEAGARLAREVRIRAGVTDEGRPVNIVVFSWPSDGEAVPFMSYYSDREDARASGPGLARAYLKLRDFLEQLRTQDRCERSLHLLAHSMGAYVLRQGLQAVIAKDPDGLVRLFDQILLAAPDEDDDAFELDSKLKPLPRIGRQVTVYFNPSDRALVISDKTKGNPDRLGSDGPRLIDMLPKKVVLVDCRNVAADADTLVQHSYYVRSPAMAFDIGSVLAGLDAEAIGNREYVLSLRAWRIIKELT
ncbi:alpha/beta hydrolase [Caulobacter sp. RL271]|uniref:Alpha/beta fold hydrolase n=1 Tax=Caulobacter segnis TaxID=88688 RepID=A0ABY4ZN91_9CAUL|nr:alpha/beta fold hydrolase [Caulobacter segnis]USQ94046.1 alpha/beta fold hydrolase [Caulobacter segnis]